MALTDNIVSYYKLDESSGNAADSVGSNTLVNINTATYAAEKINNGAVFVAASAQALAIADASQSGLDLATNLTLAGWVKFATTPSSGNLVQIVSKDKGGVTRSFHFALDNPAGTLQLKFQEFVATDTAVAVNWTPSTDTLYHVAVTRNSTTGATNFYVNGSQQGTTQTGETGTIANTTAAFVLGARDAGSPYIQCLNGALDEWGIWSRELSGAEITSLYNSGTGLSYPFSTSAIKSFNGLAKASIKSINGLAIASVKSVNGLA